MERLTNTNFDGGHYIYEDTVEKFPFTHENKGVYYGKVPDRLAAYEALNRTPAELAFDLAELERYREKGKSGELVRKKDCITKKDAEKLRGEIDTLNKRVDGWDFFTKHGIDLEKQADEICEMLEAKESGELVRVVRCGECKAYIDKNSKVELGFCAIDHLKRARNSYCDQGEGREKV